MRRAFYFCFAALCGLFGIICAWVIEEPYGGIYALLCYNLSVGILLLYKVYGDER